MAFHKRPLQKAVFITMRQPRRAFIPSFPPCWRRQEKVFKPYPWAAPSGSCTFTTWSFPICNFVKNNWCGSCHHMTSVDRTDRAHAMQEDSAFYVYAGLIIHSPAPPAAHPAKPPPTPPAPPGPGAKKPPCPAAGGAAPARTSPLPCCRAASSCCWRCACCRCAR